jgi:hypothetical protein
MPAESAGKGEKTNSKFRLDLYSFPALLRPESKGKRESIARHIPDLATTRLDDQPASHCLARIERIRKTLTVEGRGIDSRLQIHAEIDIIVEESQRPPVLLVPALRPVAS